MCTFKIDLCEKISKKKTKVSTKNTQNILTSIKSKQWGNSLNCQWIQIPSVCPPPSMFISMLLVMGTLRDRVTYFDLHTIYHITFRLTPRLYVSTGLYRMIRYSFYFHFPVLKFRPRKKGSLFQQLHYTVFPTSFSIVGFNERY